MGGPDAVGWRQRGVGTAPATPLGEAPAVGLDVGLGAAEAVEHGPALLAWVPAAGLAGVAPVVAVPARDGEGVGVGGRAHPGQPLRRRETMLCASGQAPPR